MSSNHIKNICFFTHTNYSIEEYTFVHVRGRLLNVCLSFDSTLSYKCPSLFNCNWWVLFLKDFFFVGILLMTPHVTIFRWAVPAGRSILWLGWYYFVFLRFFILFSLHSVFVSFFCGFNRCLNIYLMASFISYHFYLFIKLVYAILNDVKYYLSVCPSVYPAVCLLIFCFFFYWFNLILLIIYFEEFSQHMWAKRRYK